MPTRRPRYDDEDDYEDRPPRRRKKAARNGTNLPLVIGLVAVGALVLVGGGVGIVLLVKNRGPAGGGPLGRIAIQSDGKSITSELARDIPLGVSLHEVEQFLGSPGTEITASEWTSTSVLTSPRNGTTRPLSEYGKGPIAGRSIAKWYRWESGSNVLFIGTIVDGQGTEIAAIKVGDIRSGAKIGHIMERMDSSRWKKR